MYVSTVPNPALHKDSHSTNSKSGSYKPRPRINSIKDCGEDLHPYDFDFGNESLGLKQPESEEDEEVEIP